MSESSSPVFQESEQTSLLLVGDAADLSSCLSALGQQFTIVQQCPVDALLTAYQKVQPDLVLIAAARPDAALLEVVGQIRQLDAPVQPALLLFGDIDADWASAFIRAGGDDLLPADCASPLFQARLFGHCQCIQRQRLLEHHRALLMREEAVARAVLGSVIRDELQQDMPNLRWALSPRALFNGDLILAAKSPGGNLNLLLGGFPGRGLAASIGVLPVAEIFYTMTAKGFELVEIVLEINRRLNSLLPTEGFLAASLLEVDQDQRTGQIWNGGLSCAWLQRAGGGLEVLSSRHTPLGIVDNAQLDREMQLFTLQQNDHLLLCSSAHAYRSVGADRHALQQGLSACLLADLDESLTRVGEHLRHNLSLAEGDLSLLLLRVDQRQPQKQAVEQGVLSGAGCSARWSYQITLDPRTLREFDPRPMLTQLLVEVQGLQDHRERLYTLVAELFSNALEHGVLRLDSSLKSSPEGFAEYYMARERLLGELQDGHVRFSLEHVPSEDGGILTMEVEDSGSGFDYQRLGSGALSLEGFSGRGIGLIRNMAEEVVYFSPGNRVKITYHWVRS